LSHTVLVINPGSTSTKVALFKGEEPIFIRDVRHAKSDLAQFQSVAAQREFRLKVVEDVLAEEGVDLTSLDAVAGRGGLTAPLAGGTYAVDENMLVDLASARYGEHPCNLGAPLAAEIATRAGVAAYVTDPVVTDEMMDEARPTGLPGIYRRSVFHALNQRAAGRAACKLLDLKYEQARIIVCHMGGGISIGAHDAGRIKDVINALDGEGPMSAERTGVLPVMDVIELLENGTCSFDQLRRVVLKEGGLYAHLGTNDLRQVEALMDAGDEKAILLFRVLAYNIARQIASLGPALDGGRARPDAVVLTGGMARSERLTAAIEERLGFLAPTVVVAGELEMAALAAGAMGVLEGRAEARAYDPGEGQ
jgi:butyrate kinase